MHKEFPSALVWCYKKKKVFSASPTVILALHPVLYVLTIVLVGQIHILKLPSLRFLIVLIHLGLPVSLLDFVQKLRVT